ncbi:ABC transporter ATP-binding protein [Domibacillus aminovorans]|uniref:ABC transporter ATP-binding protein n=1 Tax=Domibacillus aminovorans TaxID=29332 RepID=A0A177KIM7_9BACI|nr:ABC transporter ATP-binding protein [Domibacillus aminovorans]OAH53243.1 ABC transporter ATP-binding protein [Domibacillus aminovorans]
MSRVLSLLKPYRLSMAAAWGLMLLELAVELVMPILIAKMIDDGIIAGNLDMVIRWGVIMIGLSLFSFAAGITNSFIAARIGQNYGFDIRKKLFEKVQSFSFAQYGHFDTSTLITRMTNDVTQLQNAVFMSLRIMLRAPLMIVFGTAMALYVHFGLSLVLVIAVPVMLVFMMFMMRRGASMFERVQKRLDKVNSVMRENLTGIRLIKAFVRSDHEKSRFQKSSKALMDETIRVIRTFESIVPLLLLVMNGALLLILWLGFVEMQNGTVTTGEIVAIINYAARIIISLSIFTFITIAFARGKASAGRIDEVLNVEQEKLNWVTETYPKDGDLTLKNVLFTYPGGTAPVLKDLSMTVKRGEMAAILGGTGSGKSALLSLIPRLYEPDSGIISIGGCDISQMKMDSLRREIGFVPQESHLFTGSIFDNIRWGKKNATEKEIVEAARKAQIHETVAALPDGYHTMIGQKGVTLSGGQKQRLSIARALIRKPDILLLDDSTSALDVKTEVALIDAITEEKCTIIIVTQKISTAEQADRIFMIEDGQVAMSGTHKELSSQNGLYKRLMESQGRKENIHEQTRG